MITCYLQGGIGNQLFQIATTIYYAATLNTHFYFVDKPFSGDIHSGATIRNTYWNTLFQSLRPFLRADYILDSTQIKEFTYTHTPLPPKIDIRRNYLLIGYFQSYKYFINPVITRKIIANVLQIDNHVAALRLKLIRLHGFYATIGAQPTSTHPTSTHPTSTQPTSTQPIPLIAMHFRRGDYIKLAHVYHSLSPAYYDRALSHLLASIASTPPPNSTSSPEEPVEKYIARVLFFCETADIACISPIFDFLESQFPHVQFVLVSPELTDWEQLLFMSICSHCIIANSTFSWWGAFLNTQINAQVYYPTQWFVNGTSSLDICPPHWYGIGDI